MNELARILADAPHVLLDFDGPICGAFAGIGDHWLADGLRAVLGEHELPAEVAATSDPFAVLRHSALLGPACAAHVDAALVELEREAVAVAPPTPGAADAITALRHAGHTVTIVSNNSEPAIRAYLDAQVLHQLVTDVVGREIGQPDLLKPHPHSILRAACGLNVDPARCVLIGDSVTDIEAAHTAGATAIGYANKPAKRAAFQRAGSAATIDAMVQLADATMPEIER